MSRLFKSIRRKSNQTNKNQNFNNQNLLQKLNNKRTNYYQNKTNYIYTIYHNRTVIQFKIQPVIKIRQIMQVSKKIEINYYFSYNIQQIAIKNDLYIIQDIKQNIINSISSLMSINKLSHSKFTQKLHNFQEDDIEKMQRQQSNNELQHLKKQNSLLKKQLDQIKSIHYNTKKQLDLYRNLLHNNSPSLVQSDTRMNEVFEMQHKKIFDLQTELQILQQKYNKAISNGGSKRQTQYAVKCKELQRRLQKTQIQYQKQIAGLKHKLMKLNASQIIDSNLKRNLPSNSLTSLNPLSGSVRRYI